MRKLFLVLLFFPLLAFSQTDTTGKRTSKPKKQRSGLGLIAGLNFANVTKASSISSSNETGFMVGAFYSPPTRGLLSLRMDLVYSKQGYDYKSNTNTGTVNKHYITFGMLKGINLGNFAQLQLGAQTAILLNAKADSTSSQGGIDPNTNPYGGGIMKIMNRFNYGFAGGLEIYPYKGIVLGGRYNISFGDMYKTPSSTSSTTPTPSFLPDVDAKNNVVQLYLGYRF